jgi:hypothetical protein
VTRPAPAGGPAAETPARVCRTLRVYFIKPSKYDDRGRVAHFWKGVLPNNTLTVLAALNESYNALRADAGVHVETVLWDEQVDGPILPETVHAIREKSSRASRRTSTHAAATSRCSSAASASRCSSAAST